MYIVSDNFARRMLQINDEDGRAWIESLPVLLDEYVQRWSLTLGMPFVLSYNYVVPAIRADGTEAVLKLGFPNRELLSEMHALQVIDGHGMVQLLEAHPGPSCRYFLRNIGVRTPARSWLGDGAGSSVCLVVG